MRKKQGESNEQKQKALKAQENAKNAAKVAALAEDILNNTPQTAPINNLGEEAMAVAMATQKYELAEKQSKMLRLEQTTERTKVKEFVDKYSSKLSCYNRNWQGFMEGIELTGTGTNSVKLVLVDPPYENSFVQQANRAGLGKLFDTMTTSGATAVVFMSYKQVGSWIQVFTKYATDWKIEGLFTCHRDPKFAYRSQNVGHKRMTDICLIAHKKDRLSGTKHGQEGRKLPDIKELETLFGDSPAGNWNYDFMIRNATVPQKWYYFLSHAFLHRVTYPCVM